MMIAMMMVRIIMLFDGDSSPWFTMHDVFTEVAYLPHRIPILARNVHTSHTKSLFSQKHPPLPHKSHVAMPSQRHQICSNYEKPHTSHAILMFFRHYLTHTQTRTQTQTETMYVCMYVCMCDFFKTAPTTPGRSGLSGLSKASKLQLVVLFRLHAKEN